LHAYLRVKLLDFLRDSTNNRFGKLIMPTATKHPRQSAKAHNASRGHPSPSGEVRAHRRRYGLSQTLLARLLDVSLRTVSGAESGPATPAQLRRNFAQTTRLCEALAEAMDADFVGQWLDQPNEMLGGLKPVEAIERGQLDLVWQVVEGLRAGSQL
jgi:DNA-binding transcriptional regulator YiaG